MKYCSTLGGRGGSEIGQVVEMRGEGGLEKNLGNKIGNIW